MAQVVSLVPHGMVVLASVRDFDPLLHVVLHLLEQAFLDGPVVLLEEVDLRLFLLEPLLEHVLEPAAEPPVKAPMKPAMRVPLLLMGLLLVLPFFVLFDGLLAALVVDLAQLFVDEDVVGSSQLDEFLLRFIRVVLVLVGVPFQSTAFVGLLDLAVSRSSADAENFPEVLSAPVALSAVVVSVVVLMAVLPPGNVLEKDQNRC